MASGVHRSERTARIAGSSRLTPRMPVGPHGDPPVCDPAEERMRRRTAKLTWLHLGSHHPLRVTPNAALRPPRPARPPSAGPGVPPRSTRHCESDANRGIAEIRGRAVREACWVSPRSVE
jgi:hypothetical protein